MKKLLLLLINLLVLIPSIVSAHTELTTSNPAANQVIKGELEKIVLTYEGKIESLSTMKLVKNGQEIPLVSVTPSENQLVGTLSTPLENGNYTVQWSIAGEDGHPIKGDIPFTVQKDVKLDQKPETQTPASQKEETKKENTTQDQTNDQNTSSPSTFKTMITVVIVVILLIGLFLLFRKKS